MKEQEKLKAIAAVLRNEDLCAEAMVSEIGCIVDVDEDENDNSESNWGDEPPGFCGNCRHCRGMFVGTDKCICAKNDCHAEPDNDEPCPNWELSAR